MTITIEAQPGEKKARPPAEVEAGPRAPAGPGPAGSASSTLKTRIESSSIITAHNSKNYYVEGDLRPARTSPFHGP